MKKYFGIFIVALAIVSSAFTVDHKSEKLVGNSYTYDLYGKAGQDIQENMDNPENYTLVGTAPLPCSGAFHRCGVENASDNGFGKPDFTKVYTPIDRN